MSLTREQIVTLHTPIKASRVAEHPYTHMSYLETWDVLAHLSRVFGVDGWDKAVLDCQLVFEDCHDVPAKGRTPAKAGVWDVTYRATVRLTVWDPDHRTPTIKEDCATGSALHQPGRGDAHDLAVKSAVSDALKRAAKDLGDQFGLSLYDRGSLGGVLTRSLVYEYAGKGAANFRPPHDPVTGEIAERKEERPAPAEVPTAPRAVRPPPGQGRLAPPPPADNDLAAAATFDDEPPPWEPPGDAFTDADRDPSPPSPPTPAERRSGNGASRVRGRPGGAPDLGRRIYAICAAQKLDLLDTLENLVGRRVTHTDQLTDVEKSEVYAALQAAKP